MDSLTKRKSGAKWLSTAFNPANKGKLHASLHVPAGQKIPLGKLKTAAAGDSKLAKRARLALTARTFRH